MPEPEFDVLGLGTIAIDDTLYVDRYPPPDQKVRVYRESRTVGGQIATALVAACRLGARCAYGAVLGNDEFSTAARRGLEAAGVDCHLVRHAPGAGPVHSVIIAGEGSGTRNIFFDVGPVVPVPFTDISRDVIGSARVLLMDQLGPDTVIHAARCAKDIGVAVVMDFEWADARRLDEMTLLADHLLVARDFAAAYTGLMTPQHAVIELRRRSLRACTAVTCGEKGLYYIVGCGQEEDVHYLPALRVQSVETTGCGDVFHGAYAAALARGMNAVECLRLASAAAGVYASRPSGWQHLPTMCDVNPLLLEIHRAEGEEHECRRSSESIGGST